MQQRPMGPQMVRYPNGMPMRPPPPGMPMRPPVGGMMMQGPYGPMMMPPPQMPAYYRPGGPQPPDEPRAGAHARAACHRLRWSGRVDTACEPTQPRTTGSAGDLCLHRSRDCPRPRR